MEQYLKDKQRELIWALAKQGYKPPQLMKIFGLPRSTTYKIVEAMPADWESPWRKVT